MSWKRLSSSPLHDYRILKTRADRYLLPRTGREHDFVVIESADWVNVVALTEDQQVVCIRQFRIGVARVTLEIPGGLVDPGERPIEAARRELLEETGYAAARFYALGSIAPNPAVQSNRCYSFLAEGCRLEGAQAPDEEEEIHVELIPLAEIPRRLADGDIEHALVAVAFQKLALLREGVLPLTPGE